MENKAHALAAGIFVLAVAALLAGLAFWLARDQGEYHVYEISTREAVTGLQPQAPVRLRGVDVGKVDSIGFDPKAQGQVLLRLSIDEGAPITQATFATLGLQGVTGLAYVQLDDEGKPAPLLPPNDSAPPRIPLKPGMLGNFLAQGTAIMDKVDKIAARVDQLLSDDNQKRAATALENIGSAAGSVEKLAGRLDATVQNKLDPALAVLPGFTVEAGKTMKALSDSAAKVGRMSDSVEETAARLNAKDGPIDRLAEGTEALSHAADSFNAATLPRINRVTEEASRAVRQLGRTANAIQDNPQSLLFGSGDVQPGPGETGFTPPPAAR